jgi:hypothetical protein
MVESVRKPWVIGLLIALAAVIAALWLLTFKDFP